MTVTCAKLAELLFDYADGGLPPEVVDAFKAHLCGCSPCGLVVTEYQLTIRVTRALPRFDALPPEVAKRLRAMVDAAAAGGTG